MKHILNLILLTGLFILTASSCKESPPSNCQCTEYLDVDFEFRLFEPIKLNEERVYGLEGNNNIVDTMTCILVDSVMKDCSKPYSGLINALPCSIYYIKRMIHSNDSIFKPSAPNTFAYENIYLLKSLDGINDHYFIDRLLANGHGEGEMITYPNIEQTNLLYSSELLINHSQNGILYDSVYLAAIKNENPVYGVLDSVYVAKHKGIISFKNGKHEKWILKH